MLTTQRCISHGGCIAFEWPRRCAYWHRPNIVKFLRQHNFNFADFDGCVYVLVVTKGSSAGTPTQKPWHLACSPDGLPP